MNIKILLLNVKTIVPFNKYDSQKNEVKFEAEVEIVNFKITCNVSYSLGKLFKLTNLAKSLDTLLVQEELLIEPDLIYECTHDFRIEKQEINFDTFEFKELEDLQFDLNKDCIKIDKEFIEQLNNKFAYGSNAPLSVNEIQVPIQHKEEFKFGIPLPIGPPPPLGDEVEIGTSGKNEKSISENLKLQGYEFYKEKIGIYKSEYDKLLSLYEINGPYNHIVPPLTNPNPIEKIGIKNTGVKFVMTEFKSFDPQVSKSICIIVSHDEIYEGEFCPSINKCNGRLINFDGRVYEGVLYQEIALSLAQSHQIETVTWNILIQQDGEGIQKYSNGDFFIGNFTRGIQNGEGTLFHSNGISTNGMWVNGKQHGDYIEIHPNGDKYLVTYADGDLIKKSITLDL